MEIGKKQCNTGVKNNESLIWPDDKNLQELTDFISNSRKVVFSKSLKKTDRHNSVVMKDIVSEEINKLKQEADKDIVIFGSEGIVSQLTNLKLIDEY